MSEQSSISGAGTQIPPKLGPYRVEGLLGQGGMGEVYRGFDERLHRPVALKRIKPDGKLPSAVKARFRREARTLAGLSHSHIVQVYDWVEQEGDDWLVMELIAGRCLADLMTGEPLDVQTALALTAQICGGLAAAHEAGIVHRDLKAGNVMLTTQGDAKLLDFGLAKQIESEHSQVAFSEGISTTGQVLGTVSYMSPEQAQGHDVDGRSDLFSLGTLLYEMLTGLSPFRGENAMESVVRICTLKQRSVGELNPRVSPAVAHFVDELLEKSRNRRPADARAAGAILERLLEGDTSSLPAADSQAVASQAVASQAVASQAVASQAVGSQAVDSEMVGSEAVESEAIDAQTTRVDLPPIARLSIDPTPVDEPTAVQERTKKSIDQTAENPTPRGPQRIPVAVMLVSILVLLAAVVGAWWWTGRGEVARPLSVAVPATGIDVGEADPNASQIIAASAIQNGLLRSLVEFQDLVVREPSKDAPSSPVELARAMAVDEILISRLECVGTTCQALLRRIRGSDGAVVSAQRYVVTPADPLRTTLSVGDHLQTIFPHRALRPGAADLSVRPDDYVQYLKLFEDDRLGRTQLEPTLDELQRLQQASPRFLEAYLFEASVARKFFAENRSAELLERAQNAIDRALELAPQDPRTLREAFAVYRDAGRFEDAGSVLRKAEQLAPGDSHLWACRAVLLEKSGESEQALTLMNEAAQREPSLTTLAELSDMSYRAGDVEATRRHLEAALQLVPGHFDTASRLAQMEFYDGSLERAVELYAELVKRQPGPSELNNLGVAYLLLRRYDEAEETFRRTLDMASSTPVALLNLADVEFLQGQREQASIRYQEVLDQIAQDPNPEDPVLLLARAQALAQLSRPEESVESLQKVVRSLPDDPQVLYSASLVFCLLKDEASAWWYAKQALALGTDLRWFGFPWFDVIRHQLESSPAK